MFNWYFRTHAWNRIALTGGIVAPVAKEVVSTLTVMHLIALPLGAIVFWSLGWVAIGGWRILLGQWQKTLAAASMPVEIRA